MVELVPEKSGSSVNARGLVASSRTMPATSLGYWAAYVIMYGPPEECPTST